jgi:hypothetical protein
MAAVTTLSTSRVEPNLGSIRAQANHGPSPTLKDGVTGLSIAICAKLKLGFRGCNSRGQLQLRYVFVTLGLFDLSP